MTEEKIEITGKVKSPSEISYGGENIVNSLLKAPVNVADTIALKRANLIKSSLIFMLVAIGCYAVFGFAIGLFAGWKVALADALKAPLVAAFSLLLCFPSLYVFACVSGAALSVLQTVALGCSCLAMTGLLLVGLAPVAWLFAVSTENLPFVVMLAFLIWFIAEMFTIRYVGKLRENPLFEQQSGITIWFAILAVVTLQMTTCMRPMLDKKISKRLWAEDKMFFMSHLSHVFETNKNNSRTQK